MNNGYNFILYPVKGIHTNIKAAVLSAVFIFTDYLLKQITHISNNKYVRKTRVERRRYRTMR